MEMISPTAQILMQVLIAVANGNTQTATDMIAGIRFFAALHRADVTVASRVRDAVLLEITSDLPQSADDKLMDSILPMLREAMASEG